ncbi:MAG: hypothetical protein KAQ63_00660 [Candidatus Moranbacteria bacterium]|nr:hypothetical protein [Candidatus Moranbacteria bacterium]
MELKKFLSLVKKHLIFFWVPFLIIFLGGLAWYDQQSSLYSGSVAVNISREGRIATQDYQYDQFYRLEADEKFGKNIVNWVGDPGLMESNRILFTKFRRGDWSDISKIKAIQPSANYVKIEFKSETIQSAIIFGEVIKKNLNQKNQQLNVKQDRNWFKLVIDDAHIVKNHINLYFVLVIFSCLGILSGIFGVLLKHYFKGFFKKTRSK